MKHTYISEIKEILEDAGITFKKVDDFRWVSYDGDTEIVFARTLGQCVEQTNKEYGE